MACGTPQTIYRYVYDPLHGGRVRRYFLVPCGRCVDCLKSRQMSYAFRAEWEALDPSNVQVLFCTFTYAPEYLPKGNELSKNEVQRFIRRLRLACEGVRVRYLFCGEHGSLYDRAHYHAILYFDKFVDFDKIASAWSLGIVDIRPFSSARGSYVAKYSVKQLGDDSDYKQPPFLLVSNSLGQYFMTVHGDFVIKNNVRVWYNLAGSPVLIPRIFMDKLFPKDTARIALNRDNIKAYDSSVALSGSYLKMKFINRVAYDARMALQSRLAGYSDPLLYASDVQRGISFRCFNKTQTILNRTKYEIGRY